MKKDAKILVVLYSHPELYPPTLNAVSSLADHYEEVHILYKPHKKDEWEWPGNVHLHPAGKAIATRAFMNSPFRKRMIAHFSFILRFLVLLWKLRPKILLLYDPYPALFYRLVRPFTIGKRPFLWYHNHDIIEPGGIQKKSMSAILSAAERTLLRRADLFTLPAVERKAYFDLRRLKGKYFTIPNFPSRKVFSRKPQRRIGGDIVVGFQGSICSGRGLEEFISLLPMKAKGKNVVFSITGFCNSELYWKSLNDRIGGLKDQGIVRLNAAVPYGKLADAMDNVNIGWAYYGMDSSLDHSMGTASNKFFESCAMGLPVLYNSKNTFEIYSNIKWAIPVELTMESISTSLAYLIENYQSLSDSAYDQFTRELNFENAFLVVLKILPGAN
jgi:hypothetical protein